MLHFNSKSIVEILCGSTPIMAVLHKGRVLWQRTISTGPYLRVVHSQLFVPYSAKLGSDSVDNTILSNTDWQADIDSVPLMPPYISEENSVSSNLVELDPLGNPVSVWVNCSGSWSVFSESDSPI